MTYIVDSFREDCSSHRLFEFQYLSFSNLKMLLGMTTSDYFFAISDVISFSFSYLIFSIRWTLPRSYLSLLYYHMCSMDPQFMTNLENDGPGLLTALNFNLFCLLLAMLIHFCRSKYLKNSLTLLWQPKYWIPNIISYMNIRLSIQIFESNLFSIIWTRMVYRFSSLVELTALTDAKWLDKFEKIMIF